MDEDCCARYRERANLLVLQIFKLSDTFSLVGNKAVRDFADDIDQADIAMIGVLFEALCFCVGAEIESYV